MMHMSQVAGRQLHLLPQHAARSPTGSQQPPQRATAWHGIRMARDLNNDYMVPLTATFPANRLGPTGDVAKVNCATCHQGAYKPLYGVSMLRRPSGARAHQAAAAPPAVSIRLRDGAATRPSDADVAAAGAARDAAAAAAMGSGGA